MSTWSFYSEVDGVFARHTFSGPDRFLAENTPPGFVAIEGEFDYLCQRVDIATGEVVDYVPPAPAADAKRTWAWNTDTRRWTETKTLAGEQDRVVEALQKGFDPLTNMQARAMREVALAAALGVTPPEGAITRLQQIDARAATLRQLQQDAMAAATRRDLLAVEAAVRAILETPG